MTAALFAVVLVVLLAALSQALLRRQAGAGRGLLVETYGVSGSVDVIGDGTRGDLATVNVRVENRGRRQAAVRLLLAAVRPDGSEVTLDRAVDYAGADALVGARRVASAGAAFYLPGGDWAAMPFRIRMRELATGREAELPLIGEAVV